VGNISWGGTGKTPVCSYLLSWAEKRGLTPALLTRGYKAKPDVLPLHVKADMAPGKCGDEPLLLAGDHPQSLILVDPVRSRAGQWALARHDPDLFILDDGFQHLKVRRDLDLVLLAPQDLMQGWNRVQPWGTWREGASALRRAGCFMVNCTGLDYKEMLQPAREKLERFGRPVFFFRLQVKGLINAEGLEVRLPDGPYWLVTGVARPERVSREATHAFGRGPQKHVALPDHAAFDRLSVKRILAQARKAGVSGLVCTPKDADKIGEHSREFLILRSSLEFVSPGPKSFAHRLENWWQATHKEKI
jgi:tetraacyldisaccharide 4'-kinase